MDTSSGTPEAQALKVTQALEILSLGDGRLQEADRFLSSIRESPSSWPILHSLIHHSPSPFSLIFAARTLYARLRADWPVFDDPTRSSAFALAADGALRCAHVRAAASPLYIFGSALGFAVSQAGDMRGEMWRVLRDKFADPVLRCNVLAAVVNEIHKVSTCDAARYTETRAFCVEQAPEVVALAVGLLRSPTMVTEDDFARLRAGVACLQAWSMYGAKRDMVVVLLPVLMVPQLADNVAETLTEIVGYSGTEWDLIVSVCDGLIEAFQKTGVPAANEVHHAVAEIACAMSEANADEMMEQASESSRVVVNKITRLLWLCIKSSDDSTFCAALEGWACWVSAENLVKESQRKLGNNQISLLVGTVVQRMTNLRFVEAVMNSEDGDAGFTEEKGFVTDLLYEASVSIGIAEYVSVVSPMFTRYCEPHPNAACAALLALAVAGDSVSNLRNKGDEEIVYGMLDRVMNLLESNTAENGIQNRCSVIRRKALHVLSCYPLSIALSSDATFYRAVRCAGAGILDSETSKPAAQLLRYLADENAKRMMQFLPELLPTCKPVLHRIPKVAAEKCVRGLGRVIAELPSKGDRMKALDELLGDMGDAIRWANCKNKVAEHEITICRNLLLIGAALSATNDSEVSRQVFDNLRDAVFSMAVAHCEKTELATSICRLLEVCVLPTLLDDEDDSRKRNEDGRLNLAITCAELAGECFQRSGPFGETAWLTTLRDLTTHVIWGAECGLPRAQECLTSSVGRALQGLSMSCKGGYDTSAEMTVSCLHLVTQILQKCGIALTPHISGMTEVATAGLRCSNVKIVRSSLAFFRQAFSTSTHTDLAEAIIVAAGGPGSVAGTILCASQLSRCASGVVDVLYALCRVVVGGGDTTKLLRELLEEGFRNDCVPRAGLDGRIREMLFRDCYCSAGNRRELRRALGEVGRVCAMAI